MGAKVVRGVSDSDRRSEDGGKVTKSQSSR